jgi:hypothetical protein
MSPALAASTRRVPGTTALRIEEAGGPVVGFVSSASGGAISADVTVYQSGGDPFSQKQLGDLRYEDITVEVGVAMPGALFDWVAASWGPQPPSRDGALLALGHDFTIQREQPFDDALIAETTIPALDASTKSAGRVAVRITPRSLGLATSPGTKLQISLAKSPHKSWLTSNFRFTIDGIDTKHVSRIEPLSVRRAIDVQTSGGGSTTISPGRITFPDLRVRLSALSAAGWYAWHKDFVIDGNNTNADERTGAISFMAPDFKTELARIDLHGMGIVRVIPAPAGDQASAASVVADLYCERMQLAAGAA